MANLGELVRQVTFDFLDGDELIVGGETGRHEIGVFLFRAGLGSSFYRSELPGLCRVLEKALEQQGQRVAYPYFRRLPKLGVGYAAALRNPGLGAATQVRRCVDEARDDARLMARLDARHRRKRFWSVLVAGEVTSVYEPIVDVATKTVFGYEALARGPVGTEFHSPVSLFESAEHEGSSSSSTACADAAVSTGPWAFPRARGSS